MQSHPTEITLTDSVIDLEQRTVIRKDDSVSPLSTLEHRLLLALIEAEGKPLAKRTILEDVWGYKPGLQSTALKNGVLRLRKKIESDPKRPDHLLTVRGVGYRLHLGVEVGDTKEEDWEAGSPVGVNPSQLEHAVEEDARRSSRLMCQMSILAFISFLFVDPFMGVDSLWTMVAVRVLFVLGGLGIYLLTYARKTLKTYLLASHLICVWTGMGVTILSYLTGGVSSLYWTMIMLIFFIATLVHPDRKSRVTLSYGSILVFFVCWMALFDRVGEPRDWAIATGGICLSACLSIMAIGFRRKQKVT